MVTPHRWTITDGAGLAVLVAAAVSLPTAPAARAQCDDQELDKLISGDPNPSDRFGVSAVMEDDVLVIGAHTDAEAGSEAGAAYVFRLRGGQWVQEQKLLGAIQTFALFGWSADVEGDVIAVGSPRYDHSPPGGGVVVDTGAVYVFRYNGAAWLFEQKLVASDLFIFAEFGSAVALDGNRLLIGAHMDNDACKGTDPTTEQNCHSGSAYVFEYNGSQWVQTAKLVASDTQLKDLFGAAVDLEGDVAVIGAWNEGNTAGPCPPTCNFDGHGAVYVFRYNGVIWKEETKLLPDDSSLGGWDNLGEQVRIRDGRVLTGASGDDDLAVNAGALYAYGFDDGLGQWVVEDKILADQALLGDFLGKSLDLRGNLAIAGSGFEDISGMFNVGAANIFQRDARSGTWSQVARLTASDGLSQDFFSFATALGEDWIAVTAVSDDHVAVDAGSAYVYRGAGDCNRNGMIDLCDIVSGASRDRDGDGVPDECAGGRPSPDLNGDGHVDGFDLALLLGEWGKCAGCPADLDGSGVVNGIDLAMLLAAWG